MFDLSAHLLLPLVLSQPVLDNVIMTTLTCFKCHKTGHFSKNCPENSALQKRPDNYKNGDEAVGTWPGTGKPQYWCEFHKKLVGHKQSDCLLDSATGTMPRVSDPDAMANTVREILADALPQHADVLLKKNIKWGIVIHLTRQADDMDKEILSKAISNLECIYAKNTNVLLGFATNEHRDDAINRLKSSKDGDIDLKMELFQSATPPAQSLTPIVLGRPTLNLAVARSLQSGQPPLSQSQSTNSSLPYSQPDLLSQSQSADVPQSMALDLPDPDPLHRRMDALEDGMNQFKHEIHRKVDSLGNKIDAALAGKSLTLYVFSDDCRSPEQPVKGQAVWFTFRRSNVEPWVACPGRITELIDNDKFEAVAVDDDGTPVPNVTVRGVHNNLAATADVAKNV